MLCNALEGLNGDFSKLGVCGEFAEKLLPQLGEWRKQMLALGGNEPGSAAHKDLAKLIAEANPEVLKAILGETQHHGLISSLVAE